MSVTRDIFSELKVTQLLTPAVRNADVNSASVDTRDHDSLMLVAHVGDSADVLSGSVFLELELEESDDDSVFNDVADADKIGGVTGATNPGTFAVIDAPAEDTRDFIVGYRGSKRYVRVVANFTGTHTTGIPIGVSAVQGHPHRSPVNT